MSMSQESTASPRRVFILGGTGFIGWHALRAFVARGWQATVISLPSPPTDGLLPDGVRLVLQDVSAMPDRDVLELLRGHDAAVFAAGADDRVTPKAPAREFYFDANVRACVRFFSLAKRAGIKRGVLLGSYFAHFARIWPELELAKHHPYIASRLAQEEESFAAALPDLELCCLELPYIFGTMPGRRPLWTPLVRYVSRTPVIFFPRGGSNMVAVEHVAEAVVGAVERGRAGASYLVGDENVCWRDWLGRISELAGRKKPVVTIPDSMARASARLVRLRHRLAGREGGLDPVEFMRIQTRETFFDPDPARRELGFGCGGLDEALAATVKASLAT